MKVEEIVEQWRSYFYNLFNENNAEKSRLELPSLSSYRIHRFYRRIRAYEVRIVLRKMRIGKAIGLDEIPIEVWKSLGNIGIK